MCLISPGLAGIHPLSIHLISCVHHPSIHHPSLQLFICSFIRLFTRLPSVHPSIHHPFAFSPYIHYPSFHPPSNHYHPTIHCHPSIHPPFIYLLIRPSAHHPPILPLSTHPSTVLSSTCHPSITRPWVHAPLHSHIPLPTVHSSTLHFSIHFLGH